MEFIPHDYQRYAIEYIERNDVAALILDMGLGKTVTTLTAIDTLLHDTFEVSRVLVIAPLRVARDTWPAEIRKWDHLKDIRYSLVIGTEKERLAALEADAEVFIINRENVKWLVDDSGLGFNYDMMVIDELSSFKSHRSQRFKALNKVRPRVRRVVGLTGTPSGNGLMDLWAEYKLLDRGRRLGQFIGEYRRTYFDPGRTNGKIVFNYIPKPDAERLIYEKISDITISMKCTDHLRMPELVSTRHTVYMDENESFVYETLKNEMILVSKSGDPDLDITAANAAVLSGKLLQMANGCIYNDGGEPQVIHDRKLDALEDIIEASNGKPIMVAYWYNHDKERIQKRFDVREIKTSRDIEDWNAGRIPVALIHPASAGHGLNLQDGGDTIVWFGLTWSLELYQQTNARLWRQGQSSRTVVIIHIVTYDTIDEDVLTALEGKRTSQDALIAAVRANLGKSE